MRYPFIWLKDSSTHELDMVRVGIFELYDFGFVKVQMGGFICVICYLFERWLELPNVNTS